MSKGLAVKMVFWIIIFLIVCIVVTYFLMGIYKQAGNVSIWGPNYVHIKEEENVDASISNVMLLDNSGNKISGYLLKSSPDTDTPFKVKFDVNIPESSTIKEGDSLTIEIRGHDSGEDYTPCTFTYGPLKPGNDFTIDTSLPAYGCNLAVNAGWTGKVSVNVIASLNGRLLDSGYNSFEARLGLSSVASTPSALCSFLKSYIDNWNKNGVSMINDWDALKLEAKTMPDKCILSDRIILVINGVDCPEALLKCTDVGFSLNARTLPVITSGSINVRKGNSISIYNAIGKESDPSGAISSVRLTFLDTTQ